MNYLKHPLTSALMLTLLTACGGASQDQGTVGASSRQINGASVDGYLAGATVFADYNNNGMRDSFEPDAITDADGYFSVNPLTEVNYCASDATTLQQASCLKVSGDKTSVIIRSVGGYDKSTGARSTASLSVKTILTGGSTDQAVSAVITPLTSVVANAATAEERTQLLTALGVTEDDLKVDFLASAGGIQSTDATTATNAAKLLEKAVKIQKTVEVLGSALQNQYTEVGKSDKLSSDVGSHVYSSLTNALLTTELTADAGSTIANKVLSDSDSVKSVLSGAETKIIQNYTDNSITKPTAIAATATATTAATQATQVSSVVDSVFTNVKTNVSLASVNSGLRAVEVVASKVKDQEKGTVDPSVAAATSVLTGNASTRSDLLTALESNKFDLSSLIGNNFTSVNTLAATAALPDSATGFTSDSDSTNAAAILSGKSLRVNDPDNAITSKQKHGRIELYFSTTTGATKSGPLTACIQYLDGTAALTPNATSDSDLSNSTTRGTYATGTWKLLGDGGYNMLVELKVTDSGTAYQSRITSVGGTDGRKQFRFDFSGSGNKRTDATWLSMDGVAAAPSALPTTNAECKARFKDVPDTALNTGS